MNEIRRFLRYVLPGTAVAVQLAAALILAHPAAAKAALKHQELTDNLSLVLTAFLASGGLGYIAANVYFALYWSWPRSKLLAIDHRGLFASLPRLEITSTDGSEIQADSLSKWQAWVLLTTHWNSRLERVERLRSVNSIVDRVVDVTHSLGATIVGSLLALGLWLLVPFARPPDARTTIAIAIPWIAVVLLMAVNYRHTRRSLEAIVNSAFADALAAETDKGRRTTLVLSLSKSPTLTGDTGPAAEADSP